MFRGRILTPMASKTTGPVPSVGEVKCELQAISKSAVFSHSARQIKLLEYLCNKVLLGEADHIKAATIAMEVFGRQWDFDESKDAIVRVEAHRLRRKLAKYYEEDGANSHIRVVLAPGGYVPEFVVNESEPDLPEDSLLAPDHPKDGFHSPQVVGIPDEQQHRRPTLLILLTVAIFLFVGAAIFITLRSRTQDATATLPPATQPVAQPAFPPTPELRILAGQTKATYVDRFGRRWGPDRYFKGGVAEP